MTSVFAAFVVHEVRTQWRSLRFRALGATFVLVSSTPAILLMLQSAESAISFGAGTYASVVFMVEIPLAAFIAFFIAVDGIAREHEEGSFQVVSLAALSNIGYVVRRWLAIACMLVPLTALPPAVAMVLAAQSGTDGLAMSLFVGPWLVRVVPLVLLVAAFALGLGTIAGSSGVALAAAMVLIFLGSNFLNDVLALFQRHLELPGELFGFDDAFTIVSLLPASQLGQVQFGGASDARWDAGAAVHRLLPAWTLFAVGALGTLVLSAMFLRRTAPNHRPMAVQPNNPLRATLRQINTFRSGFAPDLALASADRLAIAGAILLAIVALSYLHAREVHYRSLAAERYQVETDDTAPTSVDLVPTRMAIRGRIDGDGDVALRAESRVRNSGEVARSELSFELNPGLELLEFSTSVGQVRWSRTWNQLSVTVEPPIAAREERTLVVQLGGRPVDVEFNLPQARSFVDRYGSLLRAKVALELTDMSRSFTVPAISRRRVELNTTDLGPVVRYTPWNEATSPTVGDGRGSTRSFMPRTVFELDLVGHGVALLADSCGGFASADDRGDLRLVSRCELELNSLRICGGELASMVEVTDIAGFAVLPAHRAMARLHTPVLAEAAALAQRARPDLDALATAVVLEWPKPFEVEYGHGVLRQWWRRERLAEGSTAQLLLIPEATLRDSEPIAANELAAAAIAHKLLERRSVLPEEHVFFRELYRILALMRVGQLPQEAAVLMPLPGWAKYQVGVVAELTSWQARRLDYPAMVRFQALLHDLQHRVGPANLGRAVDDFLAATGMGSSTELFAHLERHGKVTLATTYSQLFVGRALPVLQLNDVSFRTTADGWEVSGGVQNDGNGDAWCPVRLRTVAEPVATDLAVAAHSTTRFTLHSRGRPEVVLLDPDHQCFRYARSARSVDGVDRVDYRGE